MDFVVLVTNAWRVFLVDKCGRNMCVCVCVCACAHARARVCVLRTCMESMDGPEFYICDNVYVCVCVHHHLQKDLGDRLLSAFGTSSGIPYSDINLHTHRAHGPKWSPESSTAEVTTLQLEFRYLTHLTGDKKYQVKFFGNFVEIFTTIAV